MPGRPAHLWHTLNVFTVCLTNSFYVEQENGMSYCIIHNLYLAIESIIWGLANWCAVGNCEVKIVWLNTFALNDLPKSCYPHWLAFAKGPELISVEFILTTDVFVLLKVTASLHDLMDIISLVKVSSNTTNNLILRFWRSEQCFGLLLYETDCKWDGSEPM